MKEERKQEIKTRGEQYTQRRKYKKVTRCSGKN
jgi:hypothetical protein